MQTPTSKAADVPVSIFEVGPRDGLQNESAILGAKQKLDLVNRLVAAGLREIEIGSFVRPEWVPQMADTELVARGLDHEGPVRFWALVPNLRGFERAASCGVRNIATFISSSETHNKRNVNRTIEESLEGLAKVAEKANTEDMKMRAYLSTVFGCPYEGDVDFERVVRIAGQLLELGAFQVSFGDTTGMGDPIQVRDGCRRLIREFGPERVALHFHDTRGLGVTNAFVAYEEGVRNLDGSIGGLGGCPYAPGAAGNLGTEDLVHVLTAMGADTGVDLVGLRRTSEWLASSVGLQIASRYHRYAMASLNA